MFDPDAHQQRINKGMVYLGVCLIAGIRPGQRKAGNPPRHSHVERD
jgi:hypothetical protein